MKNKLTTSQSAGFTKPLLLTPREDITGFILSYAGKAFLFAVTAFSVLAVLLIFFFVIKEAWPFIAGGGLREFVTSKKWYPQSHDARFGAVSILAGSMYVTIIAMIIAVPFGLLCALFLSDISPFGLRQVVKPLIEILAAIPSVAYGFFAVLVFSPFMQKHLSFHSGTNALNAGIILAIMAMPTIISMAEDSISSVSRHLREASYALGATRMETLVKVVMPAAHSGIIAAVILGMMRAIGETMVVWMASGNANQIPSPWWDVSSSVRTMTATIAGDMGETAKGSHHYQSLFAMGVVLLAFTFVLNIISEFFVAGFRKTQGGRR